MTGDGRFAELTFEARAGDVVTITACAENLDLVVDILDINGNRLAYNDDWAGGHDVESDDPALAGLNATDAAVVRLPIPVDGELTVRVNTFNGEGAGDVSVAVRLADPVELTIGETLWVPIPLAGSTPVALAVEGGSFTVTVSDPSGRLDPVARVLDASGAVVAANDDHDGLRPDLNRFDAAVGVRQAGQFELQIAEFMGRAGWVRVQVALD